MRLHRRSLVPLVTLGLVAACDSEEPISARAVPVRVLTWNVGNPNDADPRYPLRLRDQAYEDYVGERIRALDADLVFLQEVLPPTHCASFLETDPALTCYQAAERPAAAQRLLGDGYSVACDARQHVECIGVKTAFGSIEGLAPGGFALAGALTPPLPLPPCLYAAGECSDDACDQESTVSAVTAITRWGDLRLVHAHPNAAGSGDQGMYFGVPCRALQLRQVFEGLPGYGDASLVGGPPAIVAGDFNTDFDRMAQAEERALWDAHVGPGARFTDFSPRDERGDTYTTRRGSFGMAIDHVIADRATGACTVYGFDENFGEDPGTVALDEAFDWDAMPDGELYASRIDHFAIVCDLVLDLAAD